MKNILIYAISINSRLKVLKRMPISQLILKTILLGSINYINMDELFMKKMVYLTHETPLLLMKKFIFIGKFIHRELQPVEGKNKYWTETYLSVIDKRMTLLLALGRY